MTSRAEQKEKTRAKLVAAAISTFAELGFEGASTRDIAKLAGLQQGLLTYYFASKEDLWQAAAEQIFSSLRQRLRPWLGIVLTDTEERREALRVFVRITGENPQLFRFMMHQGQIDDERTRWLVKTHLRPLFKDLCILLEVDLVEGARTIYTMLGASAAIFAVPAEYKLLTRRTPLTRRAIEQHADYIAHLFVP